MAISQVFGVKNSIKSEGERLKIAIVSQPEYFRFMYESDLNDFADVFEFRTRMGLSLYDFQSLIDYKADYIFFFRGEFVPDGLLDRLDGVKIALSSEPFPRLVNNKYEYTIDSIRRYFFFKVIRRKKFDYLFHYDAASIPFFSWDRLYISGVFPFPVATSVYFPKSVEYQRDLFFIGRSTPHRERFFGHLKHIYNFLHICHGVWGTPLISYLCSSKICLNIHAENEISWEPRMQMMMACGVFVISEKITPNSYLRPGVDYIEISSPDELNSAVSYYLTHEEERLEIARSGYERVRDHLDSQRNFRQLIIDIENNKFNKFESGSARYILYLIEYILNLISRVKRLAGNIHRLF